MKGLTSVLPHLITVILLWLAAIIIIQFIKKGILNSIDKLQTDEETKEQLKQRKEKVKKIASTASIAANVIAAAVIVLIIFFVYNPTERSYEEMGNIETATVDKDFVAPAAEEIEASNVKSHDVKKSEEKEAEAQKDNIEAMEESISLFRKIAEEAKKAEDANASGSAGDVEK
ncbi:MAG: hypothetical protein ACYS1A_13925 [Planctomycetota bacterium]|jgi:hypothetical protein